MRDVTKKIKPQNTYVSSTIGGTDAIASLYYIIILGDLHAESNNTDILTIVMLNLINNILPVVDLFHVHNSLFALL